jgi:hypothetical protein
MTRGFVRFVRTNTIALLALFIALSGTTYAAATALAPNSVGTPQLKKNAVTAPKIRKGAVTNAKIAKNAVTGIKVKDDSLTGADVLESSLGTVPSATNATNATNAGNSSTVGGQTAAALTDPTAYALVAAGGTIAAADRARGIANANITHTAASGIYCFSNLGFTVQSGIVTPDNGFGDNSQVSLRIATPNGSALGGCPATAVARVQTLTINTATLADHGFYVWFTK